MQISSHMQLTLCEIIENSRNIGINPTSQVLSSIESSVNFTSTVVPFLNFPKQMFRLKDCVGGTKSVGVGEIRLVNPMKIRDFHNQLSY